MYETYADVPEILKEFYVEEEYTEKTGAATENVIVEDAEGNETVAVKVVPVYSTFTRLAKAYRGVDETLERLNMYVERGNEDLIKASAKRVLESRKWEFHDAYVLWEALEPAEPVRAKDDTGQFVGDDVSTEINEAWVDGYTQEMYESQYTTWVNQTPAFPEDTVESILAETDYSTLKIKAAKLAGIEFEGVMCSATKEDMWGLSSILSVVQQGMSVPFEFDSGETLILTPDNLEAFQAVWVPFRLSFFGEE